MHHCPHCHQELERFAFYCPRCGKPVGELVVEGDLLSILWLDIDLKAQGKWGIKTLKSGSDYLNLTGISESRPKRNANASSLRFTARTLAGEGRDIVKEAAEIFAEIQTSSQEWEVE